LPNQSDNVGKRATVVPIAAAPEIKQMGVAIVDFHHSALEGAAAGWGKIRPGLRAVKGGVAA